jgi:hypothetical protein
MSATHLSRWVHPKGTTPTLRAVEQVRIRRVTGIMRNALSDTTIRAELRHRDALASARPGRTASQRIVQRTTDMVANAAVRTDSIRTLTFSRLGGEDRTALMFVGRSIAFSPVDTPRRLTASPPSATTATPD